MRKTYKILSQIMILSASIYVLTPISFSEEEKQVTSPAQQDSQEANNKIYLRQMSKYPTLSKEFTDVIGSKIENQTPVPSSRNELYRWQLKEYKELNSDADISKIFSQNTEPTAPPSADAKETYLHQLEDYKELDKEFYHEHRREF